VGKKGASSGVTFADLRTLGAVLWRFGAFCWRHPLLSCGLAFALYVQHACGVWPLALVCAFVPLAVKTAFAIWWVYRHSSRVAGLRASITAWSRVRKVRRRWPRGCAHARLLDRNTHAEPHLVAVRADGPNVIGVVDLGGCGLTLADLSGALPKLISSMRMRHIRGVAGSLPSEALVTFEWVDELATVVELDKLLADHPPAQLREVAPGERGGPSSPMITVGLTDRGRPAEANYRRSLLAAGETGSGKSYLIWAGLAGLQLARVPTRLRVIDPAGGVELAQLREAGSWVWTVLGQEGDKPDGELVFPYRGGLRRVIEVAQPVGGIPSAVQKAAGDENPVRICLSCLRQDRPLFHVHAYTDRPSGAAGIVEEQHTAMDARLRSMSSKTRKHHPTRAEPLDLTVIDELLLLKSMLKKGIDSPMGEILAVGRKAAFFIWACSQLSQKETLGEIRDLFPQRVGLALRSRELTDAVLGSGASAQGALCHEIAEDMPGVGYRYYAGSRGYARFRGAYVPDDTIDLIARGVLLDDLIQRGVVADPDALPSIDEDDPPEFTDPGRRWLGKAARLVGRRRRSYLDGEVAEPGETDPLPLPEDDGPEIPIPAQAGAGSQGGPAV
jgi:hypothetical protein